MSYIERYGDISIEEKTINEIDNLIFSYLTYLDFSNTSINFSKYTLEQIGLEYLQMNSYRVVSKIGIAQKDAYNILKILITKERYKNIVLSNYVYKVDKNMQFSALTFELSKDLSYIAFEGTDEIISGWKEDCQLACFFPTASQKAAIEYVRKYVKLFGPKVILGGHSKGGNLALVSGMYLDKYKTFKILRIYSNDGPGLRKKEFESVEYQRIRERYIHIVPDYSMVGILLRNDRYRVVKSIKKNIFAHSMGTWLVEDDHLVLSTLSGKSKYLSKRLLEWLDTHTDEERNEFTNSLFQIFENAQVESTLELKKIQNMIRVINHFKQLDKETKKLIIELLNLNRLAGKDEKDKENSL